MCGIAGIANSFSPKENTENKVLKMCQIMRHRGPDNTTISKYPNAVFGHNRLSLIDINERSNQPFQNGNFALVFNGEIYNYLELRKNLTKEFYLEFKTTSDTEVLFFSLIHWGIELTLKRLKGMFAFAFYDILNGKVYLSRDRTGMKPLFYSVQEGQLVFSSELKGIWVLDEFKKLNEKYLSIATFAEFEYSRRLSAIIGVKQLEPGTFLTFDIETSISKIEYYFKMSDYISEPEFERRARANGNEILEEFEYIFSETIFKVMAADAKMGAFVSGGIDSSLCVAIAFQKAPLSLFTSNVVGKHSELQNSTYLSKILNANLYKHDFTPELFLKSWAKATWFYESPILSHPNAVPFQYVSELANLHSCKAVLTGEGSDELFLGYPRLLTRQFEGLIKSPFNILNSIYKKVPGISRYLNLDNNNFHEDFFQFLGGYELKEKQLENLKAYDFLKNKNIAFDQAMTLNMLERSIHSLLWRNDRMGMMHSIESRFPFLYEDIIEFSINLPRKHKIGMTSKIYNYKHPFLIDKHIVRKLTEKVLDKKLAYIQKKGFPVAGLMNISVNSEFFYNGFWQKTLGLTPSALKLIKENSHAYFIAKLASVEIWGSLFFENQTIDEVEKRILAHISLTP
ncbi:asparagine synthase (glutamine-hydrolyzing) [Algoriphagus kandeliae]|uniref:asparagine synthase (glutamine-hydrolyzing) n=1 Tax=Algoriphagus kandeliae TaxID=2562278 RepID=A0A4Y9R213_9BACT|nr:asparagine synthase (glutamine-hydrolyzing) [Algoriphagus kandeliae]TFV97225.1 asparagine synthase (glutamine-hydrolyzing) [Algoriphagus kandeliae]